VRLTLDRNADLLPDPLHRPLAHKLWVAGVDPGNSRPLGARKQSSEHPRYRAELTDAKRALFAFAELVFVLVQERKGRALGRSLDERIQEEERHPPLEQRKKTELWSITSAFGPR